MDITGDINTLLLLSVLLVPEGVVIVVCVKTLLAPPFFGEKALDGRRQNVEDTAFSFPRDMIIPRGVYHTLVSCTAHAVLIHML